MFIEALILSIIIGYLLHGSLKNLNPESIKGIYIVIMGFLIEAVMVFFIGKGILHRGTLTYCSDLIMYALIFIFIFLNKKNPWIVIMGIGFLLNTIPIFSNGGSMPVNAAAATAAQLPKDISREGLYLFSDLNTKAAFLADNIPINFIGHFVISIGDIIAAIGMSLFIITGMTNKKLLK